MVLEVTSSEEKDWNHAIQDRDKLRDFVETGLGFRFLQKVDSAFSNSATTQDCAQMTDLMNQLITSNSSKALS